MNRTIKILLYGCLMAFGQSVYAQIQPPNGDFENWEAVANGRAENPIGWGSSNFAVLFGMPQLIFKTTDAASGRFAMIVNTDTGRVSGILSNLPGQAELNELAFTDGGLPYTDRPLRMKAFVKGKVLLGDTAFIQATLTKWNVTAKRSDIVGKALYKFATTDTVYKLQTIPFTYTSGAKPDTLFLVAGFGDRGTVVVKNPKNSFYVDNIQFEGISTKTIEQHNLTDDIRLSPNPTTGSILIEHLDFQALESIQVFNNIGQLIKNDIVSHTHRWELNLNLFENGLYFIKVGKNVPKKIIVQR